MEFYSIFNSFSGCFSGVSVSWPKLQRGAMGPGFFFWFKWIQDLISDINLMKGTRTENQKWQNGKKKKKGKDIGDCFVTCQFQGRLQV